MKDSKPGITRYHSITFSRFAVAIDSQFSPHEIHVLIHGKRVKIELVASCNFLLNRLDWYAIKTSVEGTNTHAKEGLTIYFTSL